MTEISEKEFFNIILNTLKDINNEDEKLCFEQLEALKKYYKNSKVYYKELAIAQSEILYEVHANLAEEDFWLSISKKL
ncbi:MAG: hypothetical protein K2I42_04215 [Anaeroplasmataceae bacterium]|nr:hypothetical protein [Anaeroplasmataceae bacterium]